MAQKSILLLEPGYRNKYPPLGLMKLAAYHQSRGDHVRFFKAGIDDLDSSMDDRVGAWDRVYVTTLFSFEWQRTAAAIDAGIAAAGNQPERVFVGGIAASLMLDQFVHEPRWAGVRFIKGLLDGPPATSLQLSLVDGDFGADDTVGAPIEERVPDYGILQDTSYTYPVRDAYFGYASRGCIRKCAFCGVPKLEGAQREMPPLAALVHGVSTAHGEKKDLVLMDNNVTASSRYQDVIAEIRDLGFTPGASIQRDDGRSSKRRVDFNQGVDARILAKSPMYLREMATICISPLRIAFDHIGVRKVYETAVRMAADNGIISLSNYMLYNFMDSPSDLYQRMLLNIALNRELGLRIWSFPMRYQPVTLKDRSHVGKHWTRYILRSFQIMLQATHGVVSGSESFFNVAYGSNQDEFAWLLSMPHAFLYHRTHYKSGDGRPVLDEYLALRQRLSNSQEIELAASLAGPPNARGLSRNNYVAIAKDSAFDPLIRKLMMFHMLDTNHRIDQAGKTAMSIQYINHDQVLPAEEEIVEDAGLFDHETFVATAKA